MKIVDGNRVKSRLSGNKCTVYKKRSQTFQMKMSLFYFFSNVSQGKSHFKGCFKNIMKEHMDKSLNIFFFQILFSTNLNANFTMVHIDGNLKIIKTRYAKLFCVFTSTQSTVNSGCERLQSDLYVCTSLSKVRKRKSTTNFRSRISLFSEFSCFSFHSEKCFEIFYDFEISVVMKTGKIGIQICRK